jgi:hypothetical protein
VQLTVAQAARVITWANPASITYGTALSATQLNAIVSVPGALVYSPTSGSVPAAGTDTLSVTFTPTDATNLRHGHSDGADYGRAGRTCDYVG